MVLIDLVWLSRNIIIMNFLQHGPFSSERFIFGVVISEICPVRHFFSGLWVFSMGQCLLCNWRVQGSWRICSSEYEWWKLEGCCNGNPKIFELFWEGMMCSAFPPQSWKKTIFLWKIMGNVRFPTVFCWCFFQRVTKMRVFFWHILIDVMRNETASTLFMARLVGYGTSDPQRVSAWYGSNLPVGFIGT